MHICLCLYILFWKRGCSMSPAKAARNQKDTLCGHSTGTIRAALGQARLPTQLAQLADACPPSHPSQPFSAMPVKAGRGRLVKAKALSEVTEKQRRLEVRPAQPRLAVLGHSLGAKIQQSRIMCGPMQRGPVELSRPGMKAATYCHSNPAKQSNSTTRLPSAQPCAVQPSQA